MMWICPRYGHVHVLRGVYVNTSDLYMSIKKQGKTLRLQSPKKYHVWKFRDIDRFEHVHYNLRSVVYQNRPAIGGFVEAARKACLGYDRITWDEYCDNIAEFMEIGDPRKVEMQLVPFVMHDFIYAIEKLGFVDTCEDELPVFERREQ